MNDYQDDKDRWKLLSRELQLKQEVINRVKQDLHEKSEQIKEKGVEMVRMREENHLLAQEIYELQQKLQVEARIANQTNMDIPKSVQQIPLHELRTSLLASAQTYMQLQTESKEFKEKLRKIGLSVKDLDKLQSDLREKQSLMLAKQRELQKLQEQRIKEQKFDEIIQKQEQIISQLEHNMERVVQEKNMKEENQDQIEGLNVEISKLSQQLTQAQYGEGDVDENGYYYTGEQREIDRIQTQSLPQLKGLLDDLKNQLRMQMENPIIKYGLSNNSTAMDTSAGAIGTNSKKQKLYYNEYFHNDGEDDDEIQGNWEVKKAQMENLVDQERYRKQILEVNLEDDEKKQEQQIKQLQAQLRAKTEQINQNYQYV